MFFYRLSWIPDDQHVPEMLLSRKDAIRHLKLYLTKNNGILARTKNGPKILKIDEGSIDLSCKYKNQYSSNILQFYHLNTTN